MRGEEGTGAQEPGAEEPGPHHGAASMPAVMATTQARGQGFGSPGGGQGGARLV